MLVYIFHLHDFSVIYLQGYNLTFVEIMSPVCDPVVFYFYIYLQYTKVPVIQSSHKLLFTFLHDMLSFNQIFLAYGYGCNFFSLFVFVPNYSKEQI